MKSFSTFLAALGLVSSAVMAQSGQPAPEPGRMADPETTTHPAAAPSRMPMPTMGNEAGASAPAAAPAAEAGAQSSGAPGTEMAPSGSGGQLITPAIAQSRPAAATTSVGVKPQQAKNGVTYMCGGIGEDESTYMKQTAARDYDLMMTFAEKSGNYVAEVNVSIKDAHGKSVLETTCGGPILLVDLPAAGGYRIHAETGGQAIDRTVLIKGGKAQARQLTFAWPAKPAVAAGKDEKAGKESAGGNDGK